MTWVVYNRDSGTVIDRVPHYTDALVAKDNFDRTNREFGIFAEMRHEDD